MAQTEVVFFAEDDGTVPVLQWLDSLPRKVQNKVAASLKLLSDCGHNLRRPYCDYLRDEIYELRIGRGGINYRLLYFYCSDQIVISHGLIKEREVPPAGIDRAIKNKVEFAHDPAIHTFKR